MPETNIQEEIVLLMRGFFSTPVISSLGGLGIFDIMLSLSHFTVEDFECIPNKKLLNDSFRYMARTGLIECADSSNNVYKVSKLGKEVFQRCSSFYVPHSYYEYMHQYNNCLLDTSLEVEREVGRLENVIGSGRTHQRYFPPAVSFLKRKVEFDFIVDIGCGDGQFISEVLKDIPDKKAVGIDISEVAIDVTYKNLCQRYPDKQISMIFSDATDVEKWGNQLMGITGGGKVAISMWFLIHEISKNNPDNVIEYLNRIHGLFPVAALVICELVRQSDNLLAKHRTTSIMPEYLFFHELSGQGILSWEEYQKVLDNIPYKLSSERLFDEITDGDSGPIPSSFVWCLGPK